MTLQSMSLLHLKSDYAQCELATCDKNSFTITYVPQMKHHCSQHDSRAKMVEDINHFAMNSRTASGMPIQAAIVQTNEAADFFWHNAFKDYAFKLKFTTAPNESSPERDFTIGEMNVFAAQLAKAGDIPESVRFQLQKKLSHLPAQRSI